MKPIIAKLNGQTSELRILIRLLERKLKDDLSVVITSRYIPNDEAGVHIYLTLIPKPTATEWMAQ